MTLVTLAGDCFRGLYPCAWFFDFRARVSQACDYPAVELIVPVNSPRHITLAPLLSNVSLREIRGGPTEGWVPDLLFCICDVIIHTKYLWLLVIIVTVFHVIDPE